MVRVVTMVRMVRMVRKARVVFIQGEQAIRHSEQLLFYDDASIIQLKRFFWKLSVKGSDTAYKGGVESFT